MAINFPDSPSNGDTVTVGDKTWTWNGSTWDVVVSTPISNQIVDADGDTRVHVEESPDEDYLRFDTAGTERMTINPSGNVAMSGDLTVTGTIAGGSTNFPTTLDSGTMPAIEALQAKVGADSSAVATSLDYKVAQLEAISHGKILQVVRATDTTARTTTSDTFVDASISVTITPTSATSTLLIFWTNRTFVSGGTTRAQALQITDSSNVALSGAEDVLVGLSGTAGIARDYNTLIAYSAPATTSAVTYKGRFHRLAGSGSTAELANDEVTGQMFAIEVSA